MIFKFWPILKTPQKQNILKSLYSSQNSLYYNRFLTLHWDVAGKMKEKRLEKVVALSEVGGKRVTMNQMFFTELWLRMLLNPHTLPPVVRPEVMIYVERKVRLYTEVLHGGQGHL